MKRITVGLAAFVAAIGMGSAVAGAAQAAPISTEYCWYSLNGGGTLAPDNDIEAARRHYGATGYYINFGPVIADQLTTVVQVAYWGGSVGSGIRAYQWLGCYRDQTGYHDTPAYAGWTY